MGKRRESEEEGKKRRGKRQQEEGKRRGKGKGRKEEGRSEGKDKEKFKKDPKTMIVSALTSLTLPITTKKVLQVLNTTYILKVLLFLHLLLTYSPSSRRRHIAIPPSLSHYASPSSSSLLS